MSAQQDTVRAMLRVLKIFVFTTVLVQALMAMGLPTDACKSFKNQEDCIEAKMHPDMRMPNEPQLRSISGEDTNEYWLQKGKDFVLKQSRSAQNTNVAKNMILFLGDGMGLSTLTAARVLLGGEEKQLSFEKFPCTGFSKTYSLNTMVSDSAATATAYLCGVKGNYGTIGVNGHMQRGDCLAMEDPTNHVHSIAKWALDAGKAAGLVTTARVTDASPAGVYAHAADREWENDRSLRADCGKESQLPDIAYQLIHGEVGSQLKVIMGGGKREFLDKSIYANGKRSDGKNLIEDFLHQSSSNGYVETKEDLFNFNADAYERILGLFEDSHMEYHLDVMQNETCSQPRLEEMTKRAIEFMQNEKNGYFLFIEGGRIDTAHHDTEARVALDETIEFSKAVDIARKMTSDDDTLIVVTADHSHTLSIAGYQARGSDIFGIAPAKGTDDKAYLPLSYANGPSFDAFYNTEKNSRRNPEKVHTTGAHDVFPATVPLDSETHSGEDVAVFASGPWSHLFTGVYEQNLIPHMMAFAGCVGEGLKSC